MRFLSPLLLGLVLAASLATPIAARDQTFRFIDSLNRAHTVALPTKLEPRNPGQLRLYLDADLALDTMSYGEFEDLDPVGQGRMKYGRKLHFAIENADRYYQPGAPSGLEAAFPGLFGSGRTWRGTESLDSLKDRVRGDTLLQVRLIKANEARRKRQLWSGATAATGLIVGWFLLLPSTETTCTYDPVTNAQTCTDSGNKESALLGGGLMASGLVFGGLMYTMEFDEEKLARRLLSRAR